MRLATLARAASHGATATSTSRSLQAGRIPGLCLVRNLKKRGRPRASNPGAGLVSESRCRSIVGRRVCRACHSAGRRDACDGTASHDERLRVRCRSCRLCAGRVGSRIERVRCAGLAGDASHGGEASQSGSAGRHSRRIHKSVATPSLLPQASALAATSPRQTRETLGTGIPHGISLCSSQAIRNELGTSNYSLSPVVNHARHKRCAHRISCSSLFSGFSRVAHIS